ncbi:hypothetical protein WJX79_005764 [Trebouxia sp. C0005]
MGILGAMTFVRLGLEPMVKMLRRLFRAPGTWEKSSEFYILREVYRPLEFLFTIAAFTTLAENFLPQLIALPKGMIQNFAIGLDVNSVLAIGGVGGLAVGLAGREILENLFTGLIILSSSPFEVGDEVLFTPPTGNTVEGIVVDVGWYRTTIRSFEREIFNIPNSVFSRNVVLNITRKGKEWRFYEFIGLRVDDIVRAERNGARLARNRLQIEVQATTSSLPKSRKEPETNEEATQTEAKALTDGTQEGAATFHDVSPDSPSGNGMQGSGKERGAVPICIIFSSLYI